MPDFLFNPELLKKLQEQLVLMRKPGPYPLHVNVGNALDILGEILSQINEPTLQLELLKADVAKLQKELKENSDADAADEKALSDLAKKVDQIGKEVKTILPAAEEKISIAFMQLAQEIRDLKLSKEQYEDILQKLADLEAKIKETGGLTAEEAQALIDSTIAPLQQAIQRLEAKDAGQDQSIENILADLAQAKAQILEKITAPEAQVLIEESLQTVRATLEDHGERIAALEEGQSSGGLPESEVRRIIAEELAPVKEAIEALENKDDPRIQDLINRVTALEKQPPGGGISEAELRRILGEEIQKVQAVIEGLRTEFQGKIDLKADKTELEGKADKTDLETKADKADLAGKADKADLDGKVDKEGLEEEIRRIVEEELAPVKAAIEALENKEDPRIQDLINRVEALEKQPPGGGVSEAEVRRIVGEEIKKIQDAIVNLRNEFQRNLDLKADKTDLETKADKSALETKANKTDLETKADKSDLETKADKTDLETKADKTELETKADIADLETKADKTDLETKADKTDLETKADKTDLETKADKTELETKADKTELETKADKTELETKADKTDLETKADKTDLETKADKTDLETKADKTDLETKADKTDLETKADKTDLETKADKTDLETKADKSDLETKADKTDLETKADKSDLETKADKTDLETKADKSDLETKADKTDLETKADKTDLETKADKTDLETKADKEEIEKIEQTIEELREEWLKDDQNSPGSRFSRLVLTGWGIVGGFDLYSDEKYYIHITPGIGVTPVGELVVEPGLEAAESGRAQQLPCDKPQPGNLVFSHYQEYPGAAEYDFFKKPNGKEEVYEVWELLQPTDDLPADSHPLTPQTDAEFELPFITNKIVLLLPKDGKLHYLLMDREDVLEQLCCLPRQCRPEEDNSDYIYGEDYSPEDEYVSDDEVWACLHPAVRLPEIPLFRFGFFTEEECGPEELDVTEFPDIKTVDDLFKTWRPIVEDALGRLEKAIQMLIRRYHPSLFPLLDKQLFQKKLEELSEKWTRFTVSNTPPKTDISELATKYYAQYFYDWMRDLIAAYHELRWELVELMNDLRPYTLETLAKQHQHLLLGPAQQMETSGLDAPLRDAFHQPPIYNGNAARLETCRLYYQRLFQMIHGFYLERYAPKSVPPNWCFQENEEGVVEQKPNFDRLRVTPGKSYIYPLSEQSVPFYYPLLDHPHSLQHFWNYRRAKTRSVDRLLSYHATDFPEDFPSYSTRREVIRPLYYSLDPHDFYRIEGHIGKSKVRLYPKADETDLREYDVYEALQYLVRKHNLDFKVIKLTVSQLQNPEGGSASPYSIGSGDTLETAQSFRLDLLGAEHLAGVPKGGTFILVYEDEVAQARSSKKARATTTDEEENLPRVIADFSLPYKCCSVAEIIIGS